jgi:hypothetical protein
MFWADIRKKANPSSRVFGISTAYPAGSVGRQVIWIWSGGLAMMALYVASRQTDLISEKRDDERSDETTALLRESREEHSAHSPGYGERRV